MNGLLKVVGVLFYGSAEFFIYGACLMAFMNMPEFKQDQNYFVIGSLFLALISLVIGNFLMQIKNKLFVSGILIFVGVLFNFLVVLVINFLTPFLGAPEDVAQIDGMFANYTYGIPLSIVLILISIFMIKKK